MKNIGAIMHENSNSMFDACFYNALRDRHYALRVA